MIKVFYRCIRQPKYEIPEVAFTIGKEYPLDILDGYIPVIVSDGSYPWSEAVLSSRSGFFGCFQRIEREVFESHGKEWFRHTPGDPMPCDGNAKVHLLYRRGSISSARPAKRWAWDSRYEELGWCYADQEIKPEGKSSLDISTERKPDFQFTIKLPSITEILDRFSIGAPDISKAQDEISMASEPESPGERQYREKIEAQEKDEQEAEQAKADELKEASNVLGNFPDSDFSGQIGGGFRHV